MRNENSDGRNTLQVSSGDKCATSAGYAMSMSRSPLSRVDCRPSLTMKQSPTLCLAKLMAPSAVESVVAILKKAKRCWPRWGEHRNSSGRAGVLLL